MNVKTHPPHLVHRMSPCMWIARVLAAVVLASPAMMLAACGDSGPTVISPGVTPDTSTLAGTWKGRVDGSGGPSVLTTLLSADSTYSGEGENSFYCKVTGRWTVSGGQYTSTGRECGGSIVTSVAPFHKLRLTGTWSTSAGKSGTFTIDKQ